MKERWKGFVSGILVTAILSGTIGTAAATIGSKMVQANYSDIKISINGEQVTPKDANGAVVEPFAIDGTTYLPVRAVANALDLSVDWDGNNNTVLLSDMKEGSSIDFIKKMGLYKCLSDSFQELESDFTGILNGNAEALLYVTIQSGTYAGMTFLEAAQARLSKSLETVNQYYNSCDSLLDTDDVVLVAEYTRLNELAKSHYNTLDSGSSLAISNIKGAATQAYTDAVVDSSKSDIEFWAIYQEAFN